MKILRVSTKPPYIIIIGSGILKVLPEDLKNTLSFGKVAIITDSNVGPLYANNLKQAFEQANITSHIFTIKAGEESKNIETIINLARELIRASYDRKDLILALGGGVVGDIAGFLASIYLRGIPYVQVPTSLLAQVDSSVGGKTGIDLPEGKNLLGTFYQPARVYIDIDFLKTLPEVELKNGLAEVVKYGCALKKGLFLYLKRNSRKIYELDPRVIEHIVYESCYLKAKVVSKDEKESGLRRVLNFGHTLGHALEAVANYQIPHGLAVSVGMVIEAKLSNLLGVAEEDVFSPLVNLLNTLKLPARVSHLKLNVDPDEVIKFIFRDKKVWKGKLTVVLLKKIGYYSFFENPPVEAIKQALGECY